MVESAAVQRTVSRGIAEIGDAAGVVPASGDASFDLLALVGAALPVGEAAAEGDIAPAKTENDVPDSEIEGVLAALLAAGRLAETGVNAVPPQTVSADSVVDDMTDEDEGEGAADMMSLASDETSPEDVAAVAPEVFALIQSVPEAIASDEAVATDDVPVSTEAVDPEAFIGPPAPRRLAESAVFAQSDGRAAEAAAPQAELSAYAADPSVEPASVPAPKVRTASAPASVDRPDVAAAVSAPAETEPSVPQPAAPAVPGLPRVPRDRADDAPVAAAPVDAPAVMTSSASAVAASVKNEQAAGPVATAADKATASDTAAAAPARAVERAEIVRADDAADDAAETTSAAAVAAAPAAVPQERPARAERRRVDAAALPASGSTAPDLADIRAEAPAASPAPAPAPVPGSDPFAPLREAGMKTGEDAAEASLPNVAAPQPEAEAAAGPRTEIRSAFSSEIVVPQTAAPRPAEPLPPVPSARTASQDHAPHAVDAPASSAPVMNRAAEMLMADLRSRAVERQILSAIRQGRDEARVTLYPPQLGQVVIRLALDGQKVRVSMRATNEAAEETLQSGEAGLRDALGRQGFELSGFDVDSRNQEDGRRSPQRPYATPVVAARDESAGPFSIDVTA